MSNVLPYLPIYYVLLYALFAALLVFVYEEILKNAMKNIALYELESIVSFMFYYIFIY